MSNLRARLVDELLQNEQAILLTFLLALTPVMGHGVDKVARTTKPGGGENLVELMRVDMLRLSLRD